jgi:hypothetical protein
MIIVPTEEWCIERKEVEWVGEVVKGVWEGEWWDGLG